MIGRLFRRLGLAIRIGSRRLRLSRMRGRLKNLQTDTPSTRPVVRIELRRLRSLERELRRVANAKQLRYWQMRFDMATPYLKAPFIVARNARRKAKPKPESKRRGRRGKSA